MCCQKPLTQRGWRYMEGVLQVGFVLEPAGFCSGACCSLGLMMMDGGRSSSACCGILRGRGRGYCVMVLSTHPPPIAAVTDGDYVCNCFRRCFY